MKPKELLAAGLEATSLGRVLRRAGAWRGTLVLNYHRIGDPSRSELDRALFSATPEAFDAQLALLRREADVVGPDELLRDAPRGRRVAITFDDGYRDNHDNALPLLRSHGLPATFFLATGFLDRPRVAWWDEIAWMVRRSRTNSAEAEIARWIEAYKARPRPQAERLLDEIAERTGAGRAPADAADGLWMTWDMARALREAGMEVGGHSVDHPVLAHLPADEQVAEIEGCAVRLREELGTEMRWFSYPVGLPGTYDATAQAVLARLGCRLAFAFAGGYSPIGETQPFAYPRTGVQAHTSLRRISALLALPQLYARW